MALEAGLYVNGGTILGDNGMKKMMLAGVLIVCFVVAVQLMLNRAHKPGAQDEQAKAAQVGVEHVFHAQINDK